MSFDEFTWWWFLTKDGVPRISSGVRCPLSFLTCLCNYLEPKPFAIGERLVKLSDYGKSFVILLQGKLRVTRPGIRPGLPGWGPDNPDRNNLRDKEITPADREPIFGYSACLTKPQFQYVRNRTVRFCHFFPSFFVTVPIMFVTSSIIFVTFSIIFSIIFSGQTWWTVESEAYLLRNTLV